MAKVDLDEDVVRAENVESVKKALSRSRHFPNFIDAYLEYTKHQESTRKIHKWTAISIIAAAMERKVCLDLGYFTVFPNLYIFIIGESGVVRKSTSTGIGVELLRELEHLNMMSERVTAASLLQQFEEARLEYKTPHGKETQSAVYAYASELKVFLDEVFGPISQLLTTFYDCTPYDSSKPWVYKRKTEEDLEIYGPCLNILGASTQSWLAQAIPATEMEGGFSSRVIFVVEKENPEKYVAWPELRPEIAAIRPKLIEDLQQIHALRGKFKKTQAAHDYYEKWYIEFKKSIAHKTDARFKGYYGRKPTTVVKLAMILSVAEGNALTFDVSHIKSALDLLDELERNMFEAFGANGRNKLADGIQKVVELVTLLDRGQGVLQQQILEVLWRDFTGAEVQQIVGDLEKMGQIKVEKNKSDKIVYRRIIEPKNLATSHTS